MLCFASGVDLLARLAQIFKLIYLDRQLNELNDLRNCAHHARPPVRGMARCSAR